MSTYYQYQDVKVMIAHKLMNMEGWTVYGYHADHSDSMTDYYDPARWGGVAEKNGYILCVDVYGAKEPEEIREYNYTKFTYDNSTQEKIAKLEQMTVERGASEAEEASAQAAIRKLREKSEKEAENKNKYVVTGIIPGHMANPPRMNWHIEKDGIYIAKGNGILKYAKVDSYYRYDSYMEDMEKFKKDKNKYADEWVNDVVQSGHYTEENAREAVKSRVDDMEKDLEMMEKFEAFINKIDTTCGVLLGEGDRVIYEKVKITEYKKENKVVDTESGSIKDGQLFVLKRNFNYGCRAGYVYKIHETEHNGEKLYHAYKLNGKLTKECTGNANRCNYWFIGSEKNHYDMLMRWIEKGSISWCKLEEVKTPYEVEKVIKKTIKADKKGRKQIALRREIKAKNLQI